MKADIILKKVNKKIEITLMGKFVGITLQDNMDAGQEYKKIKEIFKKRGYKPSPRVNEAPQIKRKRPQIIRVLGRELINE